MAETTMACRTGSRVELPTKKLCANASAAAYKQTELNCFVSALVGMQIMQAEPESKDRKGAQTCRVGTKVG
eukprot:6190607-Pleurochrysis_carterae.AAC.1